MPIGIIRRLRLNIFKDTSLVDQDRSFLYCKDLTINAAITGSSRPSGNSNEFSPRLLKNIGTVETVLIKLKALNVTIVTTLIL